ncbi:hypothetical protein J2X06_002509 [Lysobacter niastensis]|uniref:Uncharacterized protein n=1 Tax=Lysobacter niastensis TaxID=380629 RepID=A0ABU1WD08_9GAMM|nr:hypothetical protein [Lysobacter niastensis]MDR7135300.1 hypothetical protein [Lysobacter niastensis]
MSAAPTHVNEHAQSSPFSRRPILTGIAVGIAVGVVSLLPHAFLTAEASLAFAAILIALIAGRHPAVVRAPVARVHRFDSCSLVRSWS